MNTTKILPKAERIARSIRGSCILCAVCIMLFVLARIFTAPLSLILRVPLVIFLIVFLYAIVIQLGKLKDLMAGHPEAERGYALPLPVGLIIAALLVICNVMITPCSERLNTLWDAITLGTAIYLATSTFARNTNAYQKYTALKQTEALEKENHYGKGPNSI